MEYHGIQLSHRMPWNGNISCVQGMTQCLQYLQCEDLSREMSALLVHLGGAKSCQDTGRIPGISAGEPDPTAALAQFFMFFFCTIWKGVGS